MKTYFLVVTEDCYIVPANGPVERDINYQLDFYQLGMPSPMATNQGTVWEHLSGDLPISGADSPSSGPSGTFYDTQSVVLGTSAQSLTQTFSVVLNSGTNVRLAVYAFGGWQYELSIKKYPGYVSINAIRGARSTQPPENWYQEDISHANEVPTRTGLTVFVAVLLTLRLAACKIDQGPRDLFTMEEYRLPFDSRLRIDGAASIIVVGRVLGTRDMGRPSRSEGDHRALVQLTRIKIDVETTVKGSVAGGPLDFYYFEYSRENKRELGRPCYRPILGQRRLSFLQPFADTYRSVGDVTDYTLPVHSGSHPKDFCLGKEPRCCIARILLVLGEGFDAEEFAADLHRAASAARVLCSRDVEFALLRDLARSPNTLVARSADEMLKAEQAVN